MKKVKLSMFMEVDDNSIAEIKKLEHHVDYILDLDNYPEIKSVYGVEVTEITVAPPKDKPFAKVKIKGVAGTFYKKRLRQIPEGKYYYEVAVDGNEEPCRIRDRIFVDFFGGVLMDGELPLVYDGNTTNRFMFLEEGDWEWLE